MGDGPPSFGNGSRKADLSFRWPRFSADRRPWSGGAANSGLRPGGFGVKNRTPFRREERTSSIVVAGNWPDTSNLGKRASPRHRAGIVGVLKFYRQEVALAG